MEPFEKIIKRRLLEKGVSIQKMAFDLGLDDGILYHLERGIFRYKIDVFFKICKYLGIDTDELFENWEREA